MTPRCYFTETRRPVALLFRARTRVMQHTLVALVQDRPGVLNRAVSVFRRRSINIESLTVQRTDQAGISRMTWVVTTEDLKPVIAQLEKLIDVLEVYDVRTSPDGSVAPSTRAAALPRSTPSSSLAAAQADGAA